VSGLDMRQQKGESIKEKEIKEGWNIGILE
jgi:hypothetical protein